MRAGGAQKHGHGQGQGQAQRQHKDTRSLEGTDSHVENNPPRALGLRFFCPWRCDWETQVSEFHDRMNAHASRVHAKADKRFRKLIHRPLPNDHPLMLAWRQGGGGAETIGKGTRPRPRPNGLQANAQPQPQSPGEHALRVHTTVGSNRDSENHRLSRGTDSPTPFYDKGLQDDDDDDDEEGDNDDNDHNDTVDKLLGHPANKSPSDQDSGQQWTLDALYQRAMGELDDQDRHWRLVGQQAGGADLLSPTSKQTYTRQVARFSSQWRDILQAYNDAKDARDTLHRELDQYRAKQETAMRAEHSLLLQGVDFIVGRPSSAQRGSKFDITVVSAEHRLEWAVGVRELKCLVDVRPLLSQCRRVSKLKRDVMYKGFCLPRRGKKREHGQHRLSRADNTDDDATTSMSGRGQCPHKHSRRRSCRYCDRAPLKDPAPEKQIQHHTESSPTGNGNNEYSDSETDEESSEGQGTETLLVSSRMFTTGHQPVRLSTGGTESDEEGFASHSFALFIEFGPRMNDRLPLSAYVVHHLPNLWLKRVNGLDDGQDGGSLELGTSEGEE